MWPCKAPRGQVHYAIFCFEHGHQVSQVVWCRLPRSPGLHLNFAHPQISEHSMDLNKVNLPEQVKSCMVTVSLVTDFIIILEYCEKSQNFFPAESSPVSMLRHVNLVSLWHRALQVLRLDSKMRLLYGSLSLVFSFVTHFIARG
jgi:hypothetical protein